MNKKFRQFIVLSLATVLFLSSTVFADVGKWTLADEDGVWEITVNGKTFTGYTSDWDGFSELSKDEIIDEGYVPNQDYNMKVYMQKEDSSALKSAKKTELNNTSDQSMSGIVDKAKGDISAISEGFDGLKPSISEGFNFFGGGVKDLIRMGLSVLIVVGWVWFLFTLAFNGILVAAPGAYEVVTGGGGDSSGGMYGQQGGGQKKGLGIFVSRNTKKVMSGGTNGGMGGMGGQTGEEQPLKTWIKLEMGTIIFFIIVTVCLFNGLFFKFIDFVTGFINFG